MAELLAVGSLLVVDLARAAASAAPALDRYHRRIKSAAIPTAMKADVRAIERLVRVRQVAATAWRLEGSGCRRALLPFSRVR